MTNYNVIILGPKGSGKTVYLGSLYYKLSTPGELGYYLSLPLAESKKLNRIFTILETDWPDPTAILNTDKWNFNVMVNGETGQQHKAASIVYYDYAGARLTDIQDDEAEEETSGIINDAHILLGLLDGGKFYREIYHEERDPRFWHEDVKQLCDVMVKAKDKSVHFIISKWDLFEDSDESLQRVRELLEEFDPFKNLVNSRRRVGGITRLIPVSSVGMGFVKVQPDGTMARQPRARPRPLYVETPFACVLPDMIQTEVKRAIEKAERQAAALAQPVNANLGFWDFLRLSLGRAIEKVTHIPGFNDPVIRWLAAKTQSAAVTKIRKAEEITWQNQQEAAELKEKIKDENSAMIYVLNSMTNSVTRLEHAYPSSKIY